MRGLKKITIILILLISNNIYGAKEDSLKDYLNKISEESDKNRQIEMIEKIDKYPKKRIISETLNLLKNFDAPEKQELGAEISAVIKDKKYETPIVEIIKNSSDIEVLNAAIFSAGKNQFKKATQYICPHIFTERLYKISFETLEKLGSTPCKKELKNGIEKGTKTQKSRILDFLIQSKNREFKSEILNIFKNESESLKQKATIILIGMENSDATEYFIKYLNEIESSSIAFKNYKSINELYPEKNREIVKILKNGAISDNSKISIYSIISLAMRDEDLTKEQKDLIEINLESKDSQIAPIMAKYKIYLKHEKKRLKGK
ncbi:hypothetical protein JXR93_00025 [bacterium]|nr:hypothetical protein [bacterium]